MEQSEPDEGNVGIDYSDLISTPSVNLLYMLSWDVIGLEEIASFLVQDMNRYEETGNFISIDTISGTNAHMGFRGCKEKSFLKMGILKLLMLEQVIGRNVLVFG